MPTAAPLSLCAGTAEFGLMLVEDPAGLRVERAEASHALHLRLCRVGQVHLSVAGSPPLPLRPGASVFLPAGTAASWRVGLSWHRLSFRFASGVLEALAEGEGRPLSFREPAYDPVLAHVAALIQHEAARRGRLDPAFLEPIARLLTRHVAENCFDSRSDATAAGLSEAQRQRLDAYILKTLPEPIVIERLAAAADLSQQQLLRLMKRTLGISPQQYVQQQRIELARKLLVESDLPLAEIALALGFSSQSHFHHAFRTQTGSTPRSHRESAR